MNRDRVKIAWKFDRKAARRNFGYKGNVSRGQRPRTQAATVNITLPRAVHLRNSRNHKSK
jgi:hypothetical protein